MRRGIICGLKAVDAFMQRMKFVVYQEIYDYFEVIIHSEQSPEKDKVIFGVEGHEDNINSMKELLAGEFID